MVTAIIEYSDVVIIEYSNGSRAFMTPNLTGWL